MHLRLALAAAAIVALAAVPDASAAVKLERPLKRCYVAARSDQREAIRIFASGFSPGAFVEPFIDDVFQPPPPNTAKPQADANGDLGSDDAPGFVLAPYPETRQRWFTLRLAETGRPENSVTAMAKVTRLTVTQTPHKANTSSRVRFRGRGFTQPDAAVYAHYVFAGKVRRTVRIATPTGACGLFSLKIRQFPSSIKKPRAGTWTIQFDQERKYNPHPAVFTSLPVTVAPRPHD